MPENNGGINLSPIVSSSQSEEKDTPALSDLSEHDKPWDKHRANCDVVTSHYASSEFSRYSERMADCSEFLDFRLIPNSDDGVYKLKLSSARFCRVRHCPVCQWRRSVKN